MASPTVRRRRLAAELRSIRESTGRGADRVAAALKWSPSKISRFELARTGLVPAEVAKLLDFYGVTEPRRGELMQLAYDAAGKGWWEDAGDGLPADAQLYIGYEDEAAEISIWHDEVVPGLLQTAEYARHLITSYGQIEPIAPPMVERLVKIRLRRQHILNREPPVRLSVVLDQSVLTRRAGEDHVMHGQLRHLAELAGRPSITIRILPLHVQHIVVGPGFAIFQFGSPGPAIFPDVVATEQLKKIVTIEDERDAHLHRLVFEALGRAAWDPAESREAILQTAASRWANGHTGSSPPSGFRTPF